MERIAGLVTRHRFVFADEKELQDALERVLVREAVAHKREYDLGNAGTIDFLTVLGIGVEVKVKGSPSAVLQQLMRYAERPEVVGILLVSTKSTSGRFVPPELCGKPVIVVPLWKNGL